MASLALGIVGGIFGPVGAFIGAAVGGLIDNLLIFPALFPAPNTEGPRVDGISVTSANEGTPMNWSLGPRVRVGGAILWMSDLEEVARENEIGKGGGPSNTTYEYFASVAIGFGEAKPQTFEAVRQILADAKSVYNRGRSSFYDDITLYDGSQTTPDPYLESVLGSGNVPAFFSQIYVVVQRLFIGEFGNRVPNFQGFLRQNGDMSVATAIGLVLQRGGFDPSDYDTSRVSPCLRGMNLSGVVATKESLDQLLATYSVGVQEIDGQLQFFDKGKEVPIVVDEAHISTGQQSGIRFEDQYEKNLPDEVSITFVSEDLELQPGSTRYRDVSRGDIQRENQTRFNTPVTLTSSEASAAARRIYWQAMGERRGIRFSLPARYSHVAGGDVLQITRNSIDMYVRCQKVESGANGRVEIIGALTWPGLFDQDGFGDQAGFTGSGSYTPPDLVGWIGDMAALTVIGIDNVWMYWGARPLTLGKQFRGASLYTSLDGATFQMHSTVSRKAITAETSSGPGDSLTTTWDDHNTIIVVLDDPDSLTPATATDAEILSGSRNIIAIQTRDNEWEIIGFVNVTSLGDGQYAFSRLLRGLRGTDHLTGLHSVAGATVVFLTEGKSAIGAWKATHASIGTPFYKQVPYLLPHDQVQTRKTVLRGRSMRPFSPTNLSALRRTLGIGNEDVEIRWRRRAKKLLDAFAANAGPLATDEGPEQYRVEIRAGGSQAPLLHSVTTNVPKFFFTQALRETVEATNDVSWTESLAFSVFVFQISSAVGDSPSAFIRVNQR